MLKRMDQIKVYKTFIADWEAEIRKDHESGASGRKTATDRGMVMDVFLDSVFQLACENHDFCSKSPISLVAIGGYGRGLLNPGSDIDLLFLLPKDHHAIPKDTKELVEEILYVLWDMNYKVGHASRSVQECLAEAKRDPLNRTALIDARLLVGSKSLFSELEAQFFSQCVVKKRESFLAERRGDIVQRHKKYSGTVFLQEPNVKESPGGLRDFHNLQWVMYAIRETKDLSLLRKEGKLTEKAHRELEAAFDFLLRVRSDLHYVTQTSSDILTLRLQGVLADRFDYQQENILRRIEAFMRDYYTHVKHVHQHTLSVFEMFEIEIEDKYSSSWRNKLLGHKEHEESFLRFISKSGRIYPKDDTIFTAEPALMMRLFLETQKRSLRLSPPMRKLVKGDLYLVDERFRGDPEIKAFFRQIVSQKGNVARSLRQMHRVGFLGAYFPEFGALTCLVQHEFFHRYTADEHTLRCIDELDALFHSDSEELSLYRKRYLEIDDPYSLCIAMLMHDAGRAENVREHIDGSAILAAQVCDRMKIRGESRRLITFLVDHHLTLFRTATKMDTSDPRVIEDFARQMKEVEYLDMLLVFTYADSKGTNEDGWSAWKESLILRLYNSARHYLLENEHASEEFESNKADLKRATLSLTETGVTSDQIDAHFAQMPDGYFRYRHPRDIALHASLISEFKRQQSASPDAMSCALAWGHHDKLGYSFLNLVAHDQAYLLERVSHALASCKLNILSADVFTRPDGIVLDLIRVNDRRGEAILSENKRSQVEQAIRQTRAADEVSKDDLKVERSIMSSEAPGITVPTGVWIDNVENPHYSILSIQAVDRLGLLFEILREVRRSNFSTARARICTENGVAMDSIYITDQNGRKIEDEDALAGLVTSIRSFIKTKDPTVPE